MDKTPREKAEDLASLAENGYLDLREMRAQGFLPDGSVLFFNIYNKTTWSVRRIPEKEWVETTHKEIEYFVQ